MHILIQVTTVIKGVCYALTLRNVEIMKLASKYSMVAKNSVKILYKSICSLLKNIL